MSNEENVSKAMTASAMAMLSDLPFYAHIYCQMPKIMSTEVPTMGVGKKKGEFLLNFYYNPNYIKSVIRKNGWERAKKHFKQVIHHEILHVVFKHCFLTVPPSQAREMACECSVNSYINRSDLVDKCVCAADFNLEDEKGFSYYYEQIKKMFPEMAYSSENAGEGDGEENEQNGTGSGSGSGKEKKQDGKGGSDGKSGGKLTKVKVHGKELSSLDSHDKWKDLPDDKLAEVNVRHLIQEAKSVCERTNKWGSVPAGVRDAVDELLHKDEPVVDWEVALRDFIASSSETELGYTNKRISRRYGTRPGTRKYEKLNIAIGIDTSGSIDRETLSMFFSELEWIAKSNAHLDVYECDCQIGRSYPFEDFDIEKLKSTTGGGGTDLEPVIKEASDQDYDAVIYFTDGYAPKIETDYNIPVLLVVAEDGGYGHIDRDSLPYPAQMVFYVNDGTVSVQ